MINTQIKACLSLFKSYVQDNSVAEIEFNQADNLNFGIYIDGNPSKEVVCEAIKLYGKSSSDWNKSFHTSFNVVADTDISTLIGQQLIHYFTTYGLESLGIDNDGLVYIPSEKLNLPLLEESIPLIIIKSISIDTLSDKLMNLLTSGIALSKETIKSIMELSDYIPKNRFNEIQNREVKTALYNKYNIVPDNNIEFLRYLVYKLTDSTLLIKNKETVNMLSNCDKELAYKLLKSYIDKPFINGYKSLGEIFLRYKHIFVAMKDRNRDTKTASELNHIINRIRINSKKYHKQANYNLLDSLTTIKSRAAFDVLEPDIDKELDKCSNYRLIRIYNSIEYNSCYNNKVYTIRNGKCYVKDKNKQDDTHMLIQTLLKHKIYDKLISNLKPKLQNKVVYMTDKIKYVCPTTEKQFMGNIPESSQIVLPRDTDLIVAIKWYNLDDLNEDTHYTRRVDLDLHCITPNKQYGWNSSYRSNTRDILYSGDMTNASGGAVEAFLIRKDCTEKDLLFTVNKYTDNNKDIPFTLIIAKADDAEFDKDYIINPNNILAQVEMSFDYNNRSNTSSHYQTLGQAILHEDTIQFMFNNINLGESKISNRSDLTKSLMQFYINQCNTKLTLRQLLKDCDCEITDEIEEFVQIAQEELVQIAQDDNGDLLYKKVKKHIDYNLDLDNIQKDTIIDMLAQ